MFIRKILQPDLYIIFILQTVFQNIELQHTDHAHDDFFHTRIEFLEDLDGSLLGDLRDPFHKLLSLHGIHLAHPREMFRCKGRYPLINELLLRHTDRISDREDTRIEHTDNIPSIGFTQYFALICHNLLRLRQAHDLPALYMLHLSGGIESAGADTHKGHPVSVRLIHIGLNLKDKGRKFMLHRIDQPDIRPARKRCRSHLQKVLQENLHTEVGKCRTEEYRCQFARLYQLQIVLRTGAV